MKAMITRDNYEEYLMLEADGELDAAGQQALQDFMETHPELEAERGQWHAVKLQPDPALRFPDQERLLKPAFTVRKRIIPFTLSAAAAVLLFALLIPQFFKKDPEPIQMARTSQPKQPVNPITTNPVTTNPKVINQPQVIAFESTNQKIIKSHPVAASQEMEARKPEHIAPLYATANDAELKVASEPNQELPAIQEIHSVAFNVIAEPSQKGSAVNLAPANQAAIQLLKDAMNERIGQVKTVAKNIQETALEIRFKKGALNVSF